MTSDVCEGIASRSIATLNLSFTIIVSEDTLVGGMVFVFVLGVSEFRCCLYSTALFKKSRFVDDFRAFSYFALS